MAVDVGNFVDSQVRFLNEEDSSLGSEENLPLLSQEFQQVVKDAQEPRFIKSNWQSHGLWGLLMERSYASRRPISESPVTNELVQASLRDSLWSGYPLSTVESSMDRVSDAA